MRSEIEFNYSNVFTAFWQCPQATNIKIQVKIILKSIFSVDVPLKNFQHVTEFIHRGNN